MNRYVALSSGLHALALLLVLAFLAPSAKKANATYTIDFIGSGKVIATTGQEVPAPQAAVQTPAAQTPKPEANPAPAPAPKTTKKAYAAKTEIAEKPKTQKAKAKEVPLAAPSVLEDSENEELTPSVGKEGQEGEEQPNAFGGGNIQTDFANFPYPWYITQVRNGLWSEWEKRRPAGNTLSAMVSFAIARDGKIRDLKVEKKSGDDTFDFAATSAVINAGPFAPLPMYYEKDELTVTVEFKQEN
ncbi:energy transducer TonB [Candidatus Avelusimicrobium luingense]|uniref:energy transducer TonB n=1 Tax=Candidatus Avelusimicrobium luingense TaxID=3416211 RepID=UPI003D0CF416